MKDRLAASQVHLPTDRAFVVQFAAGPIDQSSMAGRVEHLATGSTSRFESLEQLSRFLFEVLAAAQNRGATTTSPSERAISDTSTPTLPKDPDRGK